MPFMLMHYARRLMLLAIFAAAADEFDTPCLMPAAGDASLRCRLRCHYMLSPPHIDAAAAMRPLMPTLRYDVSMIFMMPPLTLFLRQLPRRRHYACFFHSAYFCFMLLPIMLMLTYAALLLRCQQCC